MGAIGVGGQGMVNLHGLLGKAGVQYVAIADVDAGHLNGAVGTVNGRYGNKDCKGYADFRELIARGDIDAISMATPDHWHAGTVIPALKAGMDVYGEKPLTHDLREGRAVCDAVKRYGRIWQTGSWQRSQGHFRRACELVRNGRLGKVHTVEVRLHHTNFTNASTAVQPVPAELNWDFWLGPAPWQPYQGTCHGAWRQVLDWGGGNMMDWIGHMGDIAQWGMGYDATGPIEIEGGSTFPPAGLYDAMLSYKFTCKYPAGVNMIVGSLDQMPPVPGTEVGARWVGDKGWVYVDRSKIDAEPKSLLREQIGPGEIHLYESVDHHQNFLDCVRSRKPTITPAETAHRAASIGHLGLIAMQTGRKIRWNPDTETIIDDPGASAMLGRAYRQPWTLA